jgi:hypothetical protein
MNTLECSALATLMVLLARTGLAQCDIWIPTDSDSSLAQVNDLCVMDHDGPGPSSPVLYATGLSSSSGGALRRWNGRAWESPGSLSGNLGPMHLLAQPVGELPAGRLLIGGAGSRVIASWDGSTLSPIGPAGSGDFSSGAMVRAITTWDPDGPGPQQPWIIAAGQFTRVGGVNVSNIAAWDGVQWRAIGPGLAFTVNAVASYDPDGDGPASPLLIAAGSTIRAWNGAIWQTMGSGLNSTTHTLAVFDPDNAGPLPPYLYAGGDFTQSGSTPVTSVAQWTGSEWTTAGSGRPAGSVRSLRVLDLDGDGEQPARLVACGTFLHSLPYVVPRTISIFDGVNWSTPLASPTNPSGIAVGSMAAVVFDPDNQGPRGLELISAGPTTHLPRPAGQDPLAYACLGAWDGERWTTLGSEVLGSINCFVAHDEDGPGPLPPALYAGGTFLYAGNQPADSLARWNGEHWIGIGTSPATARFIRELASFDPDGDGPEPAWLMGVNSTPSVFPQVLRFVDGAWSGLGGFGTRTNTVIAFDPDGPGPAHPTLFIGGHTFRRIWDGVSFVPAGSQGTGETIRFFTHDEDGAGPNTPSLYAMTSNAIDRWHGSDWTRVSSLSVSNSLAQWPVTSWDPDGNGPGLPQVLVGAMNVNGYGTAAAYNGSQWRQVGNHIFETARAITSFDPDGPGPATPQLVLGYYGGGIDNRLIARLSSNTWIPLGTGLTPVVNTNPITSFVAALMTVDPDDGGPAPPELWIGGNFIAAGGQSARAFARWRPSSMPPGLSLTPQSVSRCASQSQPTIFTTEAESDTPLVFSWQLADISQPTGWRVLTDGPLTISGQQVATISGSATAELTLVPGPAFTSATFNCLISNTCGSATTASASLVHLACCGTADFDGDGDIGTDADIEAFFACLAGNCCPTCFVLGADFNADGDTGTDADIEAFFRVLAGGNC